LPHKKEGEQSTFCHSCKWILDADNYCLVRIYIYLHTRFFQHATRVTRVHCSFYPFCIATARIVQLADA